MEGEYNVDYEVMGRASEQLTDDIASLSSMGEYITFNLDGMDSRVSDYLISVYKLNDLADQFNTLSNQTTGYQAWMDDAVGRVKGVDSDLADIVANASRTGDFEAVGAATSAGTKPDIQTPASDTRKLAKDWTKTAGGHQLLRQGRYRQKQAPQGIVHKGERLQERQSAQL